jgi:hypothetical protein
MEIHIEKLGIIKEGDIALNNLTIFCGLNNTGKTYAMYTLYALLSNKFEIRFKFIEDVVVELLKNNICTLDLSDVLEKHLGDMVNQFNEEFPNCFSELFGMQVNEFKETKFLIKNIMLDKTLERIRSLDKSEPIRFTLGNVSEWILEIAWIEETTKIVITLKESRTVTQPILVELISNFFIGLLFPSITTNCFLLPAERAGLNLFYKELSSIRNRLIHRAQKDNIKPLELLRDILTPRYALPVSDYIEYLNDLTIVKGNKADYPLQVKNIQDNIIKGKYDVDQEGNISFLPHRSNRKKLPLHFSSSTARTLFGLVFYLQHQAKQGDWLMIDEPELNLHPDNQRNLARVLAQLVNNGIKVIISTHSPYLVREFNNLIMLNKEFDSADNLRKKYKYKKDEHLNPKEVSAYLFDEAIIKPMEVDSDEGIIADTFDKVVNNLNQSSDNIYLASTTSEKE